MLFLCRMDVRDFEILSDVIRCFIHENPQRVTLMVRVDDSGPYLQGVGYRDLEQACFLPLSFFPVEIFFCILLVLFDSQCDSLTLS